MGRLKRSPAHPTLRSPADSGNIFTAAERLPSPGLTTSLNSNNPFRNRAASPANSPIVSTFGNIPNTAPERPTSRNPFLDQTEKKDTSTVRVRSASPDQGPSAMNGNRSPTKPALTGHAVELFDNLTLNDGPSSTANGIPQGQPPPYVSRPTRSENRPPRPMNGASGHFPSRSNEDPDRRLHTGKPQRNELDVFADPASPENGQRRPRPRRNSDSSINSRILSPDDERRRKERHRREREARHRGDGKSRPLTSSKSKKPNKQVDIIDSLDVTSMFGTGVFHHDGPFDACNPHRNRRGQQRAPMQAFAKDSANNTMGGCGPVNKELNFAQFHGRGEEGFTDFARSGAPKPLAEPFNCNQNQTYNYEPYTGASAPTRAGPGARAGLDRASTFNPTGRVDKIHGEESMGLGTTTHLEGAPAARAAIHRRESETDQMPGTNNVGGLGRKRSLAQKIRGISNANRGAFAASGRVTSPDGVYNERVGIPTSPGDVQNAGGMPKIKETNPFFNEYDDAYERKGQRIQIAEQQNRVGGIGAEEDQVSARARAMSSPKRAVTGGLLERRVTNDGSGGAQPESSGGGGFLHRVKSLRGGRRARPERRE